MKKEAEPKWINQFYARAGLHSSHPLPKSKEQRIYYGMIEAIGWDCFKYGDAPQGVTEEQVRDYLIKHKDRIKAEAMSDYLSLLAGVFDFLVETKQDKKR